MQPEQQNAPACRGVFSCTTRGLLNALAGADILDDGLEAGQIPRCAAQDLIADDEGRGAGNGHGFGQRPVGTQILIDAAVLDLRLYLAPVHAGGPGDVFHLGFIGEGPLMGVQLVVEGLVFVGLAELHRQRRAGGVVGGFAQDGELLVDVADLLVLREQLLNEGMSALAVAAVVVEELHHRQAALGIAALGILVGEELLGMGFYQRLVVLGLLALLLGTQGVGHLDQDLRILDQIVAHDLLDIALGQLARLHGRRKQGRAGQGGEQGMFDSHKSILLGMW